MTIEELKSKLTENLLAMLPKNMAQDVTREAAMENLAEALAEPIDEAVLDVQSYDWKGMASVAEICTMQEPQHGDVWGVTDGGTIVWPGAEPLEVAKGDIVVYNGNEWKMFLHIDPAVVDCYTKAETDERIAAAVNAEADARQTADTALSAAIAAEAAAREAGDSDLLDGIDSKISNHNSSSTSHGDIRNTMSSETSARLDADAELGRRINVEASARESADTALDSRIDSEATEREQADAELQAQIDAISSKSDVVDVVASYAELVAYDTSALFDNDVVKVLHDETQDDAESYYRWNLTTQTWGYIGSQGPFVTPAEMQTALNGKVDKVTGKGLSTNDYTTAEKNKLAGIETGANKTVVDTALSGTSTNPVQNKVVKAALDGKVDKSTVGDFRTKSQHISMGANLVVNGNGRNGDNYNFTSFKRYPTIVTNGAACSFGFNGCGREDEYISCDFTKKILFSVDIKNLAVQPVMPTHRIYVEEYDIDKNIVQTINVMYGVGTLTELTQDLKPGDTVVHLQDLSNSNWKSATTYHRGFIFWNYKNSFGYQYEPETYSRNVYPSRDSNYLWEVANVDQVNNVITLNSPWSGPLISAGTKVSRRSSGNTYPYPATESFNDLNWHHLVGTMNGVASVGTSERTTKFSQGVAYFRVGVMPTNISVAPTTDDKMAVLANLMVYELPDVSNGINGTLPIANGGTGATTASAARTNLGLGTMATKNNVSDGDINGTISDSHIASASTWNGKYTKPSTGIPKSDLASAVQTSLGKADSALQSHQSLDGYVNNIQADSTTTFGDSSTIVVGKSGKNILTRTALALYNYIKGKLDSVYAALGHTHSVKINGSTKTIAASGGTAVDLGSYDTSGTASSAVSTHNSSSSAHSSLFSAKADNTPTFSQASTRANLSGSGETMPTILGKIKKWFADLKALAFKDKVSDGDINGTISDAHIASASTWNGKANANGSNATGTWDISITGNARTATAADEAIFQGALRIGTSAVDLNTLFNDAQGEGLYWCSAADIGNVTNKPSGLSNGFLLRVQSPLSDGMDNLQFLYPRGTEAYYYTRRSTASGGGTWGAWNQRWYGATSTYDTSSERAVNSSAVSSAISGKENTSNKVSSWSGTPNNTRYPSEKLVKDSLDAKASLTDLSRHAVAAAGSSERWVNILDVDVTGFSYLSFPIYIVSYSQGGAIHNAFIEFNHSSGMSVRNATDLVIGSDQGKTVASTEPLCYVLDAQTNKLHIWMFEPVNGAAEFTVRTTNVSFLNKFSYPSETTAVSSSSKPSGAVNFSKRNGVTNEERTAWNGKQDALPTSGTASGTYAINIKGNAATATDATYASKIGSSSSPQGIGSTSQPVFVDIDGSVKPCGSVNATLVGGYKIIIGAPTTTPESNAIYFY